ncbi:MAG: threonylcarbamoyl-AMP synthase [Verrucomicrobia bacterium]|nr:threonylcarbamoyl-AMP synthase [Verrucomicrobiota bacterium]
MNRRGPTTAEVVGARDPGERARAVARAAELLRQGEAVALPTETVYGLAADATRADAVARLFELKGRPGRNPIIVHVVGVEMARRCATEWPRTADRLARAFWPGPLTMVLPRSPIIPDAVTGGGPTVGLRWPAHPVMQEVIQACGFPLAAPSANPSQALSPTSAEHVVKSMGHQLRLIVDGGPCPVGIESTVVDLTAHPPRLLRPGIVSTAALEAVIGAVDDPPREGAPADDGVHPLHSPGQMLKHYAPRSPLAVWSWQDVSDLARRLASQGLSPSRTILLIQRQMPAAGRWLAIRQLPHDPASFARALYAELHQSDDLDPDLIVVEAPPSIPAWQAIWDRLRRASAK